MAKIVILSAFAKEITHFFEHISNFKEITKKHFTFYTGSYAGHEIICAITGVGMVNSAAISSLVINWFEPDLLLFCGVAGGVSHAVKIGDVVIANEVAQVELLTLKSIFSNTPFADSLINPHHKVYQPNWLSSGSFPIPERSLNSFSVHVGKMVSSDQFPAPKEEYPRLLNENVLAVDMETAAMYQVGWIAKIPTLAVRGISNVLKADGTDPDMAQADIDEVPRRAVAISLQLLERLV